MRAWQPAFLGVSALLGEPLEGSLASLGEAIEKETTELAAALRSGSREARARAIAKVVARVAVDIDSLRLR